MKYLFLLLFAISASAFANDSINQKAIENYLNNIQNFTAEFAQIDANNNTAKGMFYLQKPGKFRWQYQDQPLLIVSNGNILTYFDKSLNEVTKVPANSTLAGFLAKDEISFEGDIKLLEFTANEHFTKVHITQTEKPEEGSLIMYFDTAPIKLTMLEVLDQNGEATKVVFDKQNFADEIAKDKFVFKDPNFHKNAWE